MSGTVYVVHHVRKDDEYGDDAKLVGVYSSQRSADEAVARLRDKPGFIDHPAGFEVSPYELDVDHWEGGFVTHYGGV